jgi:hypothetical protein
MTLIIVNAVLQNVQSAEHVVELSGKSQNWRKIMSRVPDTSISGQRNFLEESFSNNERILFTFCGVFPDRNPFGDKMTNSSGRKSPTTTSVGHFNLFVCLCHLRPFHWIITHLRPSVSSENVHYVLTPFDYCISHRYAHVTYARFLFHIIISYQKSQKNKEYTIFRFLSVTPFCYLVDVQVGNIFR